MTLFTATITKDEAGNDAMIVTSDPEYADGIVYMGTDEMMTLTPHETRVRDQILAAMTAPPHRSPSAPQSEPADPPEVKRTILEHIKHDPARVALGFGLGSVAAAFCALAGGLVFQAFAQGF